jgi:hypothetical protein
LGLAGYITDESIVEIDIRPFVSGQVKRIFDKQTLGVHHSGVRLPRAGTIARKTGAIGGPL